MRPLRLAATVAAVATLSACAVTGDRTPVPDAPGDGGAAPMAGAFLLDLATIDARLATDEDAIAAAQELCLRIADGASEKESLADVEELFTDIAPADRELILASAKENVC